jgi:membrane associated rhomboid family serine protease
VSGSWGTLPDLLSGWAGRFGDERQPGSGSNVSSVGASGAIFAVLGAEYVFLHEHRKLMGAAGQARRRSLLVLGVVNLVFGVATTLGDGPVRIDNWGHLGGLIGGVALGWFISPLFVLRRHPDYPDSNHLLAVDINPLNRKYWAVSIYSAVLLVILLAAVLITR